MPGDLELRQCNSAWTDLGGWGGIGGCPYPKRNVLVTVVCFSWSYDMYTVNIACVCMYCVCVCIQCIYV